MAVGSRSIVGAAVELELSVSYEDLDDAGDSTAIDGGFWFEVNDTFALGLGVGFDEDVTTYGAGMHWYFGE